MKPTAPDNLRGTGLVARIMSTYAKIKCPVCGDVMYVGKNISRMPECELCGVAMRRVMV